MDDTGVSFGPQQVYGPPSPDLTVAPTTVSTMPDYISDYTPVVPSSDDMGQAMAAAAGVPFVPAPSGATADPVGSGGLNNNPSVNPTANGGWQSIATALINSAAKGFSTFVAGSPSVGVPGARSITGKTTGGGLLTTASGQTNWAMVALVVAGAGVGIWALVKFA